MVLLVVDTQKGCFDERLYAFETVRNNIRQLIAAARENHVEVVYVQHDDGPGTDLDKSTEKYEICEEFAPENGERRFEKNVNSAFHPMTGLTEYLQSRGERDIMTIGVSTDYCMDATVKSGFEKGFNIIVPSYTNSTYDNPYFDNEDNSHGGGDPAPARGSVTRERRSGIVRKKWSIQSGLPLRQTKKRSVNCSWKCCG